MLLKRTLAAGMMTNWQSFSTLYRVDAIEAVSSPRLPATAGKLSVPSIGSMLLKRRRPAVGQVPSGLFQYPLSGRCY